MKISDKLSIKVQLWVEAYAQGEPIDHEVIMLVLSESNGDEKMVLTPKFAIVLSMKGALVGDVITSTKYFDTIYPSDPFLDNSVKSMVTDMVEARAKQLAAADKGDPSDQPNG